MTNVRLGDPARVDRRCLPGPRAHRHVDSWSPGTGSTFALLPPDNATGNFTKVVQRVPVKIVLDRQPGARHPGSPRPFGRGHHRHRRRREPRTNPHSTQKTRTPRK